MGKIIWFPKLSCILILKINEDSSHGDLFTQFFRGANKILLNKLKEGGQIIIKPQNDAARERILQSIKKYELKKGFDVDIWEKDEMLQCPAIRLTQIQLLFQFLKQDFLLS